MMKKRIVSILLVLLVCCLAGCGVKGDAEAAFHAMMNTFRTGDMESIKPYYDFNNESKFVNSDVSDEMVQVLLETMKDMKYKIEKTEVVDDNTVRITAKVTTVDFSRVMTRYVEQMELKVESEEYQAMIAEPDTEQSDYQKIATEQMKTVLKSKDLGTKEKTITITMVRRKDGTWAPGQDKENFYQALFKGLIEAVHSLI